METFSWRAFRFLTFIGVITASCYWESEPGKAIYGHNRETIYGMTLDACARHCHEVTSYKCVALDYEGDTCCTHTVTRDQVGSDYISYNAILYHYVCLEREKERNETFQLMKMKIPKPSSAEPFQAFPTKGKIECGIRCTSDDRCYSFTVLHSSDQTDTCNLYKWWNYVMESSANGVFMWKEMDIRNYSVNN